MDEEQQPEQDPGLENVGGVAGIMLEIDTASADMGDFLRWVARAKDEGELEDVRFEDMVGLVYSYCRAKNETDIVERTDEESG